jgi:hypothetical protein
VSECFGLHFKIDLGIDMGRIERNVTQPGADRVNVYAGTQEVHRCGVANRVGANLFGAQGRDLVACLEHVAFHEGMDAKPCDPFSPMLDCTLFFPKFSD